MIIREANPADNLALLGLTASCGMPGVVGLRTERAPDFFRLLNERGPSTVLVAEHNARITGCIAASRHECFYRGERLPVRYIGDFRIAPSYTKTRTAFALVHELQKRLLADDADLMLCTTLRGNQPVEAFLTGRAGIPPFRPCGEFYGWLIFPCIRDHAGSRLVEPIGDTMRLEELASFYNRQTGRYRLAPATTPADLSGKINLTVNHSGRIIAALTLADQMNLKQNVVTFLPPGLRIVSAAGGLLHRIYPGFSLPRTGQAVHLINLKRMASVPAASPDLQYLLNYGRHLCYNQHYSFLSATFHAGDPYCKLVKTMPKLLVRSQVWITSLKNNQSLPDDISKGILFEDYSLV